MNANQDFIKLLRQIHQNRIHALNVQMVVKNAMVNVFKISFNINKI